MAHAWGVQLLLSRPALREATQSQAVPGLLPCSTPPQSCVLQTWHSRGCNYHLCTWHLHRSTFKSLQHSQKKANKYVQPSEAPNSASSLTVHTDRKYPQHQVKEKLCVLFGDAVEGSLSLFKGHILGKRTRVEGSLHRLLRDCQVPVTLKYRTVKQHLCG